jgi:DNA-binding NarL/FixJ family response regulator
MPPWTHEPTDYADYADYAHHAEAAERAVHPPATALTPQELVALQLLACGYSPNQIAELWGTALVDVLWQLQRPLKLLGAATAHEAVVAARARGLIV